MKMVMIDTCAWIDFFKSKTGDFCNQIIANDAPPIVGTSYVIQ